jgi:hypothetical protein
MSAKLNRDRVGYRIAEYLRHSSLGLGTDPSVPFYTGNNASIPVVSQCSHLNVPVFFCVYQVSTQFKICQKFAVQVECLLLTASPPRRFDDRSLGSRRIMFISMYGYGCVVTDR